MKRCRDFEKLDPYLRLFVVTIKMAQKNNDIEFLTGKGVEDLGEFLGISYVTCVRIRLKFKKRYKIREDLMSMEVTCDTCGKKVRINRYKVRGRYQCAKCRSITASKVEVKEVVEVGGESR